MSSEVISEPVDLVADELITSSKDDDDDDVDFDTVRNNSLLTLWNIFYEWLPTVEKYKFANGFESCDATF